MTDRNKVLITGASGNIGGKVRRHLEARDGIDLTLIDRDPKDDKAVIPAELSLYDQSWVDHFQGINTVIHLAAEAGPHAAWNTLEGANIDAVINIYEASIAKRVRRVIFASSMHTVMGYLGWRARITTEAPSCPGNFYGATKVFGERLGKSYTERHGLSVICLRIGWVQSGDNLPGSHMGDVSTQQLWLSTRDLCRGVEQSILARDVQFAVLNLTSNNANMPWDLSQTSTILGFDPQDGHTPVPEPWQVHLRKWLKRGKRRLGHLTRIH